MVVELLMQQVKKSYLKLLSTYLLLLSVSTAAAFSVVVSDLQNNNLTIAYSSQNSENLDSDYLHQVCFEQLKKMSRVYGGFLIQSPKGSPESQIDYYLRVEIQKKSSGWSVEYSLDSAWVQGETGNIYKVAYGDLSERDLIYTTRQVFDEIINKVYNEAGIFEYPLAFVENSSKGYQIVLSDPLFEFEKSIHKSDNPIVELRWDHKAESLFFTEVTDKGMMLKNINLKNLRIKTLYCSSLISSPVVSNDGNYLYFVADFSHLPHMYQLNLKNHHLKSLTSGPLWVSEIHPIPNTNDFTLTANRSGIPQVYTFNPQKISFERMTFLQRFAGNGIISSTGDMFYISFDQGNNLSLYRKSALGQHHECLTSKIDISHLDIAQNQTFLGLSVSVNHEKNAIAFLSLKDGRTQIISSKNSRKSLAFSPQPNLNSLVKK